MLNKHKITNKFCLRKPQIWESQDAINYYQHFTCEISSRKENLSAKSGKTSAVLQQLLTSNRQNRLESVEQIIAVCLQSLGLLTAQAYTAMVQSIACNK